MVYSLWRPAIIYRVPRASIRSFEDMLASAREVEYKKKVNQRHPQMSQNDVSFAATRDI